MTIEAARLDPRPGARGACATAGPDTIRVARAQLDSAVTERGRAYAKRLAPPVRK